MSDDSYVYCPDTENAHYGVGRLGKHVTLLDYFNKLPRQRTDDHFTRARLPAFAFLAGFVVMVAANIINRKPPLNSIQKHIAFGTFATAASYGFRRITDNYTAYEEAVLRHYIETHPEDFPSFGTILIIDLIIFSTLKSEIFSFPF